MNNAETKTFKKTIWVSKKDVFLKKIKHLNKILAKNGKDAITVNFENYRSVQVEFTTHAKGDSFENDLVETRSVEMCDAICSGYIKVGMSDATYNYLGTVAFEDGVKQVCCKDEDYKDYFLEKFREGYCDHCKSTRKNRKCYYLFLNETTGEVLQIGSTCAKEFFGIDSTAFLEAYGNTFFVDYSGCDEELTNFWRGSMTVEFGEVAALLDYATNGFLRWNKASCDAEPGAPIYEQPTTAAVRHLINANPLDLKPEVWKAPNCGILKYEEVLDFWKTKYENESSTFAFNCYNAIKAGYAVDLSLGTFCYAIFAAFNAKVRAIREAEAASKTYVPCAHEVGKRVDIKGKITALREFTATIEGTENYYNNYWGEEVEKKIVDFTEDNGTLYHFTTSASSFFELNVGDRISMRCTIGETKPFKGVPYTRVSRPVATVLEKSTDAA